MSETTEERLRGHLSEILRMAPERFRENAHVMDELGADSLQFLDFIAMIEKDFGLKLQGSDTYQLATLKKASAFLDERMEEMRKRKVEAVDPGSGGSTEKLLADDESGGMWMDGGGRLHCPVDIGMPLTGRNNLGETPLFKLAGDLRWKHVERFSGVPSKELCDDTGERLYATFFYVEANFSESRPMASFGENDQIHIVSTLKSSGGSVLDGFHYLFPGRFDRGAVPEGPPPEGTPYLRTSNIFVKMLQGAQWLKKSKPVQAGMDLVPMVDGSPETAGWSREADENDRFENMPEGWIALSDGPVETHYDIIPDRDLNGAGLLYFANYPQILDVCERRVLEEMLPVRFEEGVVDRRTTVRRRSAYLSNASQSDRIRVRVEVAVRDPFSASGGPEGEPIHLWMNYVMWRCSDDRKMMVCTVRKTVTGVTWGDTGALGELRGRRTEV